MLLLEFLQPRGITQVRLCETIGITGPDLNRFVKDGSDVTARKAWLFAQALGTTPLYWMAQQARHDLWHARPRRRVRLIIGPGRRH